MCIRQGAVDADSKGVRFKETPLFICRNFCRRPFHMNVLLRPADIFDSLSRMHRIRLFFSYIT